MKKDNQKQVTKEELSDLFQPDNVRNGSIQKIKEWGKLEGLYSLLQVNSHVILCIYIDWTRY